MCSRISWLWHCGDRADRPNICVCGAVNMVHMCNMQHALWLTHEAAVSPDLPADLPRMACAQSDVADDAQVLKNNSEMYSEKDLYVGKVLTVHQRTFELLEADEFTYQYMENNRHVYLMADWEAGLKAIQAQLQGKGFTIYKPAMSMQGRV